MKHWKIACTILTLAFAFSLSQSVQAQDFKSSDNPKVVKQSDTHGKSTNTKPHKKIAPRKIKFHPEDVNGPTNNVRLNRELRFVKKFKLLVTSAATFPSMSPDDKVPK